MVVGGSLNMLGPTIDMIWVGKLGAAAIIYTIYFRMGKWKHKRV